jgi:hypothetical protein
MRYSTAKLEALMTPPGVRDGRTVTQPGRTERVGNFTRDPRWAPFDGPSWWRRSPAISKSERPQEDFASRFCSFVGVDHWPGSLILRFAPPEESRVPDLR